MPLTLNVTGSYFELEQFVNKLEGLSAPFLVTGFTLSAASTRTRTAGDLSLVLQGRSSSSPPEAAATTPTPVAPATTGQ